MASDEARAIEEYTGQVRAYWDTATALYLEHVGSTFQSARYPGGSAREMAGALNRFLAAAAGIRPGQHVLDAGCGVCGPAVDIALAVAGVTIEAITISPVQAEIARARVAAAGLAGRIAVHARDFHALPFRDAAFDVALFLESVCYSYDLQRLFREVRRVLRPGGTLYIKDVFAPERPLTEEEEEQVTRMTQIYASKACTVRAITDTLAEAGFRAIAARSLQDDLSFLPSIRAFFTPRSGLALLNEFGKRHYQRFAALPVFAAAITAHA